MYGRLGKCAMMGKVLLLHRTPSLARDNRQQQTAHFLQEVAPGGQGG
jgi:hypothetical protein